MDKKKLRLLNAIVHELDSLHWADWMELAALTGCEDLARRHWSIDWPEVIVDQPTAQYDATKYFVETLLQRDEANLKTIIDYLNVPVKMQERDPRLFAELFGHSHGLLDEIKLMGRINSFELNQIVLRIQGDIDEDPETAIGATKELLESTMKYILTGSGCNLTGKEDFPKLLKLTQKSLKLDPSDIDSNAKGRDLIKRMLSNLGQIVSGLNELRGDYGTGHGRIGPSGVTPRHARLAVNAGAALAVFLIETFEHHQTSHN